MIKNAAPIIKDSMQHYPKNTSFLTNNNKTEDLAEKNQTVSLKMYTKNLPTYSQSKFVNITVDETGFIKASLINSLGNKIANATVIYKINGTPSNTTTDNNGRFVIYISSKALVEIIYAGDGYNLPVNVSVNFQGVVSPRESTVIVADNFTAYAVDYYAGERGQNFTFN